MKNNDFFFLKNALDTIPHSPQDDCTILGIKLIHCLGILLYKYCICHFDGKNDGVSNGELKTTSI